MEVFIPVDGSLKEANNVNYDIEGFHIQTQYISSLFLAIIKNHKTKLPRIDPGSPLPRLYEHLFFL